jgi:hypothetical protein
MINFILASLLFTQVQTLEFNTITSPRIAGDSFDITIVARTASGDTFRYSFPATLRTTRDDLWSYVEPQLINFYQGVCRRKVRVSIADTLRLQCDANGIIGLSNQITVIPNDAKELMIICPGESIAPGSPSGKFLSTPESQTAGSQFSIKVYMVDQCYNPVAARSDLIHFSSTDCFARLTDGNLVDGRGIFPVTLRRAGSQRIFAQSDNSSIAADTSSSLDIFANDFARLVLLLPGEELLSGDTTTHTNQTPGKSGTALRQYVKEPFFIRIIATDDCYNRVHNTNDTVYLNSDFSVSSEPTQSPLFDSTVFAITYDSTGENQNLWTVGGNFESYRTIVNIEAKTRRIENLNPDTVRAGSIITLEIILYDANDMPIRGKYTYFSVQTGNGVMIDSFGMTDTLGKTRARFICSSASGSEMDSIAIQADDFTYIFGIFIEGDPTVLEGKVIAFPNPFGYNQNWTEIQYILPTSCDITMAVYDPFGNPVYTRKFRQGEEGAKYGINKVTWDGKDEKGRKVANGIYLLKFWGTVLTSKAFDKTHRIAVVW